MQRIDGALLPVFTGFVAFAGDREDAVCRPVERAGQQEVVPDGLHGLAVVFVRQVTHLLRIIEQQIERDHLRVRFGELVEHGGDVRSWPGPTLPGLQCAVVDVDVHDVGAGRGGGVAEPLAAEVEADPFERVEQADGGQGGEDRGHDQPDREAAFACVLRWRRST